MGDDGLDHLRYNVFCFVCHMLSHTLSLDGVFLPLNHVGTAEIQNISPFGKVSKD